MRHKWATAIIIGMIVLTVLPIAVWLISQPAPTAAPVETIAQSNNPHIIALSHPDQIASWQSTFHDNARKNLEIDTLRPQVIDGIEIAAAVDTVPEEETIIIEIDNTDIDLTAAEVNITDGATTDTVVEDVSITSPSSAVTARNETETTIEISDAAENVTSAESPVETIRINAVGNNAVPDEVVLQFTARSDQKARLAYIETIGGTVVQTISELDMMTVQLDTMSETLPASDILESAEPNYYIFPQTTVPTSDTYYTQQWALDAIGVPGAWEQLPQNPAGVTIAVIDSGICAEHPELAGRILSGWDFVEDDATPQDTFNHGCGVAGIIAANIDNSMGIAGVAPNTKIMPLRVLDANGTGTYADVAEALIYAADQGAAIVNLSLGANADSSLLEQAVNYAADRGALIIAAAGNTNGGAATYPAAYANVVGVGAVDQSLEAAGFSSSSADLWAPGANILTLNNGNGYISEDGTSYAAAHVSGVAALNIALGGSLRVDGGLVNTGYSVVVNVPDMQPTEPPMEPEISASAVIGTDDRELVPDTTIYPYHGLVIIELFGGLQCSGALITLQHVLTAGHCVYDDGVYFSLNNMTVTPGYDGSVGVAAELDVTQRFIANVWETNGGQTIPGEGFDYAVLELEAPFDPEVVTVLNPFAGDDAYLQGINVEIAGFPGDLCMGGSCAMYRHDGPFTQVNATTLQYEIDTAGGVSGSAVRDNQNRIVGVHNGCRPDCGGGVQFNLASRVTDDLIQEIVDWGIPVNIMGDVTPPITLVEFLPGAPDGNNGWYVSDILVTLTASDPIPGTGVALTQWSLDGGLNWNTYEDPFTLTQEGEYDLWVRSADFAGNIETPIVVPVKLDKTPPVVQLVTGETQFVRTELINFEVDAYDPMPGSGLLSVTTTFNGEDVGTTPFVIDPFWFDLGPLPVNVIAEDIAGWTSEDSDSFELIATLESLEETVIRLCEEYDIHITNGGICNSLLAKIKAATRSRDAGRYHTAANQLGALLNQLRAQTGKHISEEANHILKQDTEYVIDHLGDGTSYAGVQACTADVWLANQGVWPAPNSPADNVHAVFPNLPSSVLKDGIVDLNKDGLPDTLAEALAYSGGNGKSGATENLLREGTAAILNASEPTYNFPQDWWEVAADVSDALAGNPPTMQSLADELSNLNSLGCPLG